MMGYSAASQRRYNEKARVFLSVCLNRNRSEDMAVYNKLQEYLAATGLSRQAALKRIILEAPLPDAGEAPASEEAPSPEDS